MSDFSSIFDVVGRSARRFAGAGLFALAGLIGAAVLVDDAQAMTFKLVSLGGHCGAACPQVIAAEGEIQKNAGEDFIAFLREASQTDRLRNIVFIHSPGGNVVGAMKLGAVFRKAGTAVVVARAEEGQGIGSDAHFLSAQCLSACVYAIMGGKTRVVPPQSKLGVHRTSSFRYVGKDPAGAEPGYSKIPTPTSFGREQRSHRGGAGFARRQHPHAQPPGGGALAAWKRALLSAPIRLTASASRHKRASFADR
jgi:hypothetical protein